MEYKGIRYKYVFDGLAGTIYKYTYVFDGLAGTSYKIYGEEKEIAFLQSPDDILYLENQLENIKPNENFTYEEIVDMILDTYDY